MDTVFSKNIFSKLSDLLNQKVEKQYIESVHRFISQYFASISEMELEERHLDEIYGEVMVHWRELKKRQPGEIKLKVFNPRVEEHGFSSPHTLIMLTMDDMPFLVRSMVMALNRLGVNIHLIFHTGNLHVQRDQKGELIKIEKTIEETSAHHTIDAAILIEIDRHLDEEKVLGEIESTIRETINDVQCMVKDFDPMLERFAKLLALPLHTSAHVCEAEALEIQAFLKWMLDDHFIFLGSAEYTVDNEEQLNLVHDSSLGLMKESRFVVSAGFLEHLSTAKSVIKNDYPLIISKTSNRSTVNRGSHCDSICIKYFNENGKVSKLVRFVGLFTSSAYHANPENVPILRQKVLAVLELAGFARRSHDGKALFHVLETFPRDELFQIDIEELKSIAIGVLQLQERQRIRLFVHQDPYQRYVLCMVYVPRDIYNTEIRIKMQNILQYEFGGKNINFKPNFTKSVLCRIDYVIRTNPNEPFKVVDIKEVERKLMNAARDWRDDLREALIETEGERYGIINYNRYSHAFPASYREAFMPSVAVNDIYHIEKCLSENRLSMCFYRLLEESEDRIRFKLFQANKGIALTDVLPILENMGLRVLEERPYKISLAEGSVWISDFGMQVCSTLLSLDAISNLFQETFSRVWLGEAENDEFNQLVIQAGLSWREITLLRAYAMYMQQLGCHYSQKYIADTLGEYPALAKALVDLFYIRFDVHNTYDNRAELAGKSLAQINEMLANVANLDQDRIIRRYLDIIKATVRTNYFQLNKLGYPKHYISFKLLPREIPEVPKPVPMYEVFVYSPRVEGVHLRGAKVARGGLRWSDRREDFRTEVLGLVKAQQVKNAVIVPLGAKGGFVPKKLPVNGTREEVMAEGIECYKTFIRGLLDITDNMVDGKCVTPEAVIRYDMDDPYLVVAADKGTATFSDIANAVSQEYNFWMGDAFASGGSNGYDHKKMGITARGAWESVKRHFFELGKDIQTTDFTVVGIGDMSGDVFGNGMLLSKHIRLCAAFNHLHIFIDPNPDAAVSFLERKRLFELPRSTWKDYNSELISKGGGVFERSAKSIPVSLEMKERFGITADSIQPNELIKTLLRSRIDLIWNGGIGTYVKSTSENHIDVGDRTNDPLRINANELHCKVVGEGGNLGFTQLARVEFALNGGLICTDAIDNSAGVDCSDHEVNIKILLNEAVNQGKLTVDERNQLLAEMADEVAELVLKNNYHQTQSISHVFTYGSSALEAYLELIKTLERVGQLDRDMEFIPSDKALRARRAAGAGLTAPEFSVLMAYTKTALKKELLASNLPDEPYFERYLHAEFPTVLKARFSDVMRAHKLRREIIVTQLTNEVITLMGLSFVNRIQGESGTSVGGVCRALAAAIELLDMRSLWQKVEALDGKVSAAIQRSLMDDIARLARRTCRWILKNQLQALDVEAFVAKYKVAVQKVIKLSPEYFDNQTKQAKRQKISYYHRKGVPKAFAEKVVDLTFLSAVMDIVEHSQASKIELEQFVEGFFACNQVMCLGWLRSTLEQYRDNGDYWVTLLGSGLRDSLDFDQSRMVMGIFNASQKQGQGKSIKTLINDWQMGFHPLIEKWLDMLRDVQASDYDLIQLSVMIRNLSRVSLTVLNGIDAFKANL